MALVHASYLACGLLPLETRLLCASLFTKVVASSGLHHFLVRIAFLAVAGSAILVQSQGFCWNSCAVRLVKYGKKY
jgi:hypothetical protein